MAFQARERLHALAVHPFVLVAVQAGVRIGNELMEAVAVTCLAVDVLHEYML